jgi:hypothetical protein
MVTRIGRGQRPWIGGRDHTTHRLAALIGSDRVALILLMAASALAAAAALVVAGGGASTAAPAIRIGMILVVTALFIALGFRLARVPIR